MSLYINRIKSKVYLDGKAWKVNIGTMRKEDNDEGLFSSDRFVLLSRDFKYLIPRKE